VQGVGSQAQYLRLMGYLETLAIVRRVGVLEATPGQMRVQLDLNVGMRGFRTLLAGGNVLRPVGEPPVEGAPASGLPRYTMQ